MATRNPGSSQTIPCPALPCAYVLPSGKRCPFNCAEGSDRCVMHPRAVSPRARLMSPLAVPVAVPAVNPNTDR